MIYTLSLLLTIQDEVKSTVEATAKKKREEKKPEKTLVSSKDIRSMLGTAEVIEID